MIAIFQLIASISASIDMQYKMSHLSIAKSNKFVKIAMPISMQNLIFQQKILKNSKTEKIMYYKESYEHVFISLVIEYLRGRIRKRSKPVNIQQIFLLKISMKKSKAFF